MEHSIEAQFEEMSAVLERFSIPENFAKVRMAGLEIANAFRSGQKVIACGNGGSMADAMHFAEELSGRYRTDRPPLPAIAISDPSFITCTANDYGYEHVFARFVEGFGTPGDILLAISTSGNSPNVLRAAERAKSKAMQVISLTGNDGGKLASLSDIEIRVPHHGFADRIQEIHIKVLHSFIWLVERELWHL